MNINLIFFLLLLPLASLAQSPLTEIEGSMSIYQPHDSLSIHIGRGAGKENRGFGNTFVGTMAGSKNESFSNSFFGSYAGANLTGPQTSLTHGSRNSFFGAGAGQNSTTCTGNSLFGCGAGRENNGFANSFFGASSGREDLLGTNNSFFGSRSGSKNQGYIINPFTLDTLQHASDNSFFGSRSGWQNETGENNTFIGSHAGQNNIGGEIIDDGESQYFNGDGSDNVFIGAYAGANNESGQENILIGSSAGRSIVNGRENIMIGHYSGLNARGSGNIFIGRGPYIRLPGNADSIVNEQLTIGNYENVDPLIFGKFTEEYLRIHGELDVGRTTTPHLNFDESSIQAKENTDPVDLYANFSDKLHINTSGSEGALRVQVQGATKLRVRSNGSVTLGANTGVPSNVVYVSDNYQMGIGVSSPDATLHIKDFAKLEPQTTSPACNSDIHEGRIYYDKTFKKFRACVGFSGGQVSHGWVNMH